MGVAASDSPARPRLVPNRHVRPAPGPRPTRRPLEFHASLPGYAPTPLVDAPALAERLGVARVYVKDESRRLGLPSFKILGASWATYRAVVDRVEGDIRASPSLEELRARLASARPLALVAATDGNHGRAVARMAALLGLESRIFVPAGTAQARIRAIESEGATVTVVDGTYDDAVARSAEEAGEASLVVSDTSWPGYEDVPRWVIEGYSTILWEIDDELARRNARPPDVVVVQIGVGALAAAVTRHFRRANSGIAPTIVAVEPTRAACVLASVAAGRIVSVAGPHDSIMAGLNCGTPSVVAWPIVSSGIDLFLAIDDDRAREAMRLLAEASVVSGETGAAGVGGLVDLVESGERDAASLSGDAHVLVFSTEGATDPAAYERIVGRSPERVA